jgi:hypothetical protein
MSSAKVALSMPAEVIRRTPLADALCRCDRRLRRLAVLGVHSIQDRRQFVAAELLVDRLRYERAQRLRATRRGLLLHRCRGAARGARSAREGPTTTVPALDQVLA